jgi:hypothetical protein
MAKKPASPKPKPAKAAELIVPGAGSPSQLTV